MRRALRAAFAQFTQATKLADVTDSGPRTASQNFALGSSVAISEDQSTMVVGSPSDTLDSSGANFLNDAGSASIYIKSGGVWTFQQRVTGGGSYGRYAYDNFGQSVAISGDTLIVGSPNHDYDNAGGSVNDAGAVFVYTRTAGVWSFQQKIIATGTNARLTLNYFGNSVAVSGDTALIGSEGNKYDASGAGSLNGAGAAFVFTRSGSTWSLQQKIVGEGTNGRNASDAFGKKVALSGDTAVIGVPDQDYDETGANMYAAAGAAYVFTRTAGVWSFQQKLVGTIGRFGSDAFGTSVAIDADTIIVGAPGQDKDAADANTVLGSGAAYIFIRSAGVWSAQQKIIGFGTNGRVANDGFGNAVAVSGNFAVVGAALQDYDAAGANSLNSAGAVYSFTRSAGVWSNEQKIVATGTNARAALDAFGTAVALSGNSFITGAPSQDFDAVGASENFDSGAGFVFEKSGGVWSQTGKVVDTTDPVARMGSSSIKYGNAVAISEDQSTMVVGAPDDGTDASGNNFIVSSGAVFVYIKSSGSWVLQQKIVATGTNARLKSNYFGASVGISGDTIIVGAAGNSFDAAGANGLSNAGAAFVYTRSGGVWSLQQKLVGTGTAGRVASDSFGASVAISADTVVVGATGQDTDAAGGSSVNGGGAAFVFTRSGSTWSLQQKLVGTGTNARVASDAFGSAVAIDVDTIAVGVAGQDYDAAGANLLSGAGAAYMFFRTGSTWALEGKLVATGTNARNAGDAFAGAISVSGDTVVMGAMLHTYDEAGANSLSNSGAAFVFTRTAGVWTQQKKLIPTGTNARNSADYFGSGVAVSGTVIAVGAYWHSYNVTGGSGTAAGAMFVFQGAGSGWAQSQKIIATGTNARAIQDQFGVCIAARGNYILVGAPQQDYDAAGGTYVYNSGAAFVYQK